MTEQKIDLGSNALRVFTSFVKELSSVLNERDFDVVLACGDSGSVMAAFTKYIYDEVGKSIPPVLLLPTYRAENASADELHAQQQLLVSQAVKQLDGLKPQRVLFVDDEIGTGNSFQMATQALMSAASIDQIECTVLAEDDGFDNRDNIKGVKIDFRPFSKHQDDLYNAIFWFIPSNYERPVAEAIKSTDTRVDHDKWPMNILLGVPVKTRVNGIPRFTKEPIEQVVNVEPRLPELQSKFQEYVRKLVSEATQAKGGF